MNEQFSRTSLLYGQDAVNKFHKSRVAVFGIGGVGGHVVEALIRSGIGTIDIIDNDTVSESNIRLEAKANRNLARIHLYKKSNQDSFFAKQIIWFVISFLKLKTKFIRFYFQYTLRFLIRKMKRQIEKDNALLNEFIANRNHMIKERSADKIKQLAFTKEVVLELNPLIDGAIGENLVVNEIKKLSNDYILINDFSLRFNPPIYNRKKNDRIYSIQIDHLLISKAGLFILETKNWSRESIKSLDMRSPIEQIRRSSYALFVLLNSDRNGFKSKLESHHWGERRIPIQNVVVMINEKPDTEFRHVKVKSLKELNGYIEFFEPIFSDEEFDEISKGIIDLHNRENRV